MKKLILSLAVAGIVAGCSKAEDSTSNQQEASSSEQVSAQQANSQQVALGSGIDLDAMDTGVRPQDDFFAYVNGSWLEQTEIPADKSRWGTFDQLAELSTERVKRLIEEAGEHAETAEAKKIGAIFNSFMDEQQIEKLGMQAIAGELAKIDAIESREQLASYFAYADTIGYDAPFGVFINQDVKNVESYTAYFWQSGLGMPDRDYYFDDSEKGKQLQQAYRDYLVKVQKLAGLDAAAPKADAVYKLERDLAEHQWTRVDNRDPDKTYNKKTLDELAELMPAIDWNTYLSEAKLKGLDAVIVGQPDYFEEANRIIADTDLDTWKRYLKVRLLTSMAPYMHSDLAQARFDFYGTAIRGVTEMEPRWKRGVQAVNGAVGELVGKRYVDKHFPPEAKARMLELVDNLKAAYRDSIESLTWMSEETKQQALEKLASFSTKIGYPDEWRDYSALDVSADDLVGNVLASRRFEADYERGKLGKPIDRGEWHMHPQRVNAYYNPPMNEIVFPAAILQPPFFNIDAEDAVNYGGIGAVIGHEIGHGFDDKGSKYDGKGYLNNWWTDNDRANFETLTGQLVQQYREFEPVEGEHINGELTLGENIGDLSGLGIAYKAYKMSLDGEEAPVIDGFTGDQRLFMGWAQVWRGKTRDEALRTRLKTDPHSPKKYRVLGVLPNIPAFYTAFDVKEGDRMYLPEEERVTIW